jgi:hypothetical protein
VTSTFQSGIAALGNTTITGSANVTTTIQTGNAALGNTTVTGFANVVGSLQSGIAGLGNTTITGFANVTTTIQTGNAALGNTTVTGSTTLNGTLQAGNTTISGFANVTGTFQSGVTAHGNTTITGFANVTTTIQTGNAGLGNTTVTGFANIVGPLQSGTASLGNTTITGTLALSTFSVGNVTSTGFVNVAGTLAVRGNTTIGNATVNAIFADTTNMVVTINTNSTDSGSALSVGGRIYAGGGIKFSDGTTQTTAPTNVNPDGSISAIRQGNSTVSVSDSGSLGTVTINTTDSANTSKTILSVNSTAVVLSTPTTSANTTATLNFNNFGSIVGKQFTVATASATLIDSFDTTTLRSADYKITASRSGAAYMATNLNLVHDGSGVYSTQYGTIYSSTEIVLFTANVDSTTVRVYAVSDNTTSTTLKFFRHGLT